MSGDRLELLRAGPAVPVPVQALGPGQDHLVAGAGQPEQTGMIGLLDEPVAVGIHRTGDDLEQAAELLSAAGGTDRAGPGALRDAGLLADAAASWPKSPAVITPSPSWAGMTSTIAPGAVFTQVGGRLRDLSLGRFRVMMRDRSAMPLYGPAREASL